MGKAGSAACCIPAAIPAALPAPLALLGTAAAALEGARLRLERGLGRALGSALASGPEQHQDLPAPPPLCKSLSSPMCWQGSAICKSHFPWLCPHRSAAPVRGADGHFPTPGAAPMKRLGEGEPSLLSALLFFFFLSLLLAFCACRHHCTLCSQTC